MVYQEVGCNKPCLEKRSIRREVNNTDKKEREKCQKKTVGSQKSRSEGEKEEKELEKVDDRSAPVVESNNSENDSDELPDIKL